MSTFLVWLRVVGILGISLAVIFANLAEIANLGLIRSSATLAVLRYAIIPATLALFHVVMVQRFQGDVRLAFSWSPSSWWRLWTRHNPMGSCIWTANALNGGGQAIVWISPLGVEFFIVGIGLVGLPASHIGRVDFVQHWSGSRCRIEHDCPWLRTPLFLSAEVGHGIVAQCDSRSSD